MLNPAILELTGAEVDAQRHLLAGFEDNAQGLIERNPRGSPMTLMSHFLLRPGASPGCICNPVLQNYNTDDASFFLDGHAAEIANYLRPFAARQCALVERALHGRLTAVWEELGAPGALRWHFIVTIRRDTELDEHPIHADTFDGTMAAFALLSTKVPTPIYPRAVFEPTALAGFVVESRGPAAPADVGVTFRPYAIRVADGREGPRRAANSAALVVLPGAVAHSVPDRAPRAAGSATVDSSGSRVAADGDARWFCRVSVELVPSCGGELYDAPALGRGAWAQALAPGWPARLRERTAVLVARHVWGDSVFAGAAELLFPQ